MEIITEEYASEYKDRAAKANQARTQYDLVPPSGTYVVVNTHMRREISGSKGTPCLVPTMRILKVVNVEKATEQKEADGCVMHDGHRDHGDCAHGEQQGALGHGQG
jgi:hypothetical protein